MKLVWGMLWRLYFEFVWLWHVAKLKSPENKKQKDIKKVHFVSKARFPCNCNKVQVGLIWTGTQGDCPEKLVQPLSCFHWVTVVKIMRFRPMSILTWISQNELFSLWQRWHQKSNNVELSPWQYLNLSRIKKNFAITNLSESEKIKARIDKKYFQWINFIFPQILIFHSNFKLLLHENKLPLNSQWHFDIFKRLDDAIN